MFGNVFNENFESYAKPLWQKVKELDESMSFSTNGISSEKLNRLEESFLRSQS